MSPLTVRQREVVGLAAEGLTYKEMGARLFLSAETVKTHARLAFIRLDARTMSQAVAVAIRAGLI